MDARMPNVPCRILLCALLLTAGTACRRSASATEEAPVLTGSERFAWDQKAADRTELSKLRYAMYVDGTRTEIAGATCSDTAGAAGFSCTCPLPKMSPGAHTLQVAAYVMDGSSVKESSRSAPVRVVIR
jgi:hypothetical protein